MLSPSALLRRFAAGTELRELVVGGSSGNQARTPRVHAVTQQLILFPPHPLHLLPYLDLPR